MPIYAYRCAACGHAKDVLQKVSDPVLTVCPNCGASAFQKQVTAAGFQLKGSGWYVTDFRDGGSKPAGAAAPSNKDGGKADEAKGDAKPAADTSNAASSASASASSGSASSPAPSGSTSSASTGTPSGSQSGTPTSGAK